MTGSLDEQTDPRVLPPGSWIALDDVTIDKAGVWTRRNGYSFLAYPDTVPAFGPVPIRYTTDRFPQVDPPRFTVPYAVDTFGDALYACCFRTGNDARSPLIATYSTRDEWEAKDDMPPFRLERRPEIRLTRELEAAASVIIGDVLWTAYKVSDPAAPKVFLRGVHLSSDAVVQDDVLFFTLENATAVFTLIAVNGLVVGNYTRTSGVQSYNEATFDPTSRAIVRDVVMLLCPTTPGVEPRFSVCENNSGTAGLYYYFAASTNTGSEMQILTRIPGGSSLPIATRTVSADVYSLAVCYARGSQGVFLSYSLDTADAGETWVCAYADSLAVEWSPVLVEAKKWGQIDNVYTHSDTGVSRIYTTGLRSAVGAGVHLAYRPARASNGAFDQPLVMASGGSQAARAWSWRGVAYAPVVLSEPTGSVSGVLVSLTETNGSVPWMSPVVGSWSVGVYGTFQAHASWIVNHPARTRQDTGNDVFYFATPTKAGVRQTRIDRVKVTGPRYQMPLPATEAQGLAVFPGALTCFFDGERVFEAGFLARPVLEGAVVTGAGAALEAGTRLYIACWEATDAKGNVHVSAASAPLTVDVTPAGYVTLSVYTNRFTRHATKDDTRDNGARLVIYRTKVNGTTFYRLTTPTATNQAVGTSPERPLENDPSVSTISFVDYVPDVDVGALGYGFYTGNLAGAIPGAVQEGAPCPPTAFVLNTKNRLFAISADDTKTILYSRLFLPGEGPAFPAAFQIFLSDTTQGATALGALGDKLLIFTKGRIYYVFGDGPADTGATSSAAFSEPILFSDALGCIEPRSVAATPLGVVFRANDNGIYLVTQGLEVKRISGPVEDSLRPVDYLSVHVDARRGWVVWTCYSRDFNGTLCLCWSYWTNTWCRWIPGRTSTAGQAPTTACLWGGSHVYGVELPHGGELGLVARENDLRDQVVNSGGLAAYTPIWPVVTTPWIHVGAINGFQRVRRVQVRGRVRAPVDEEGEIRMTIQHDEEETGGQLLSYTLSLINGLPRLDINAHVARQKCSSIRVSLELRDETTENSMSLSAIAFEIAGKAGFKKLSGWNKGAGN